MDKEYLNVLNDELKYTKKRLHKLPIKDKCIAKQQIIQIQRDIERNSNMLGGELNEQTIKLGKNTHL